jgi:hypothetical protein
MRIAYGNLANSVISATTATSPYVYANLENDRVASKYRTSTLSSVATVIDLGSYSDPVECVAVIGHNLSSSATVTFGFNSVNSFPGATSQTVTYNSGMMLKFFTMPSSEALTTETPEYLLTEDGDRLTTEYNYRYCQVGVTDAANPDSFIEFGKVWCSPYVTVDPFSLLGYTVSMVSGDVMYHGRGRQKYAITRDSWRRFELSFPESAYSMVEMIETMHDAVGNHSPVIFANFDDLRGYALVEPCYCSIDGDVSFKHSERMRFAYSLAMEEEL